MYYLDDGTIGGSLEDIQADLPRIEVQGKALGLHLNVGKTEVLCHGESVVGSLLSAVLGLQYVHAALPLSGVKQCAPTRRNNFISWK